jgi:hypothetical protein
MSRHAAEVAELRRSVLESAGATEPALRLAAFLGQDLPAMWARYVTKVRDQSYRITDSDISDLISQGLSEDAIFEVTIAAALGAAGVRLEAGLSALTPAR